MTFALVNETIGNDARVFLAGTCDLPVGEGIVITPIFFSAMFFETEAEAKEVAKQLPGLWDVTQMIGGGGDLGNGEFEL